MSRFKLPAAACGLVVALGGCVGTTEPMNEPITVAPRGDNPNLPLPQTPKAATDTRSPPQAGSVR